MLEEKRLDSSIECGHPHLQVRIRELRLVSERLLLLTGLDRGMVAGVREFLVASQIATGDVIPFMYHTMMHATVPALPYLSITEDQPGCLTIDCDNQHSIFVGPLLLDLLKLRVARSGSVAMQIVNVAHPELLSGMVLLANQSAVSSNLIHAANGTELTSVLGTGCPGESILVGQMHHQATSAFNAGVRAGGEERSGEQRACRIFAAATSHSPKGLDEPEGILGPDVLQAMDLGFDVDGSTWWPLYHRSNEALNKTSEISRRHAGRTPEEMANDADPY